VRRTARDLARGGLARGDDQRRHGESTRRLGALGRGGCFGERALAKRQAEWEQTLVLLPMAELSVYAIVRFAS
jgi:hypothetical protein